MKKKVLILNKEQCIGCQYCSMAAPERLQPDESDGRVSIQGSKQREYLQRATIRPDEEEECREAVDTCPTGALHLDE